MADLLLKSPLKYEPKRTNRWFVRFPTDIGIQTWALTKATRPTININTVAMPFLNTETYVSGRYKWSPIALSIRDFIAPSQAQAVMEWVRLHAESVTGRMGYNVGSAKNIEIEMLDPVGVVIEKWLCVNCIATNDVNFGSLDYSSDGVMEISLTIQPQYCELIY